jgi:cell division protein FtsB
MGRHPEHSTPQQERRRRRRRSGGIVKFVSDKAIPLLIAVLGLLAALATAWGATKSADVNDLQESEVSLERTVTSLAEEKASLEAQVSELEAELAGAEPIAPTGEDEPDGTGPPVTSSPSSQPASVLRDTGGTPLTFSSDYAIDLDSNAPDWSVEQGHGDLRFFYGDSTGAFLGTGEVSIVDHVPTKQDCEDATVLLPSLPEELTRDGLQFCMRSSDDRVVYVHVVDIDEEAKTVTLDIVVWE